MTTSEAKTLLSQTSPLARQYESGAISSDQFYDLMVSTHGLTVTKEVFFDSFADIFTPIPSTYALIRRLKPRYRLGLLSNTNACHAERRVRTCEVFPLFDAVTLSFEAGMLKPAEGIFRQHLHAINMQPEETLYIDDIPENVDAARAIGMVALHYRSPEGLLKDLQELRVQCT